MPRGKAPHLPADIEMWWSVVDRAVEEVPKAVPGIDADAMRLCMTLRTAANLVFFDLSDHLTQHSSLTTNQLLNVLMILTLHGELEFHRLTRFANMKKATASVLVDAMVGQGLLSRRPSPDDGRVILLSLTELGRAQFDQGFGAYNARERFWAEGLSAAEGETLTALLKKLVDFRIAQSP